MFTSWLVLAGVGWQVRNANPTNRTHEPAQVEQGKPGDQDKQWTGRYRAAANTLLPPTRRRIRPIGQAGEGHNLI